MKPTILTYSGIYFDFVNTTPDMVTIADIAHGLSNTCRYGGQCREFYSVAQHSILCSYLVPQEYALQGLLHDAAEAYIGDIPSPLKRLLPDYQAIEDRIERVVMGKFDITLPLHESVKRADLVALATERRDLMNKDGDLWTQLEGVEPCSERIHPMGARDAYYRFLNRFNQLYN